MKRFSTKNKKWITVEELIKTAEEWDERYAKVTVQALEFYDWEDLTNLQREFLSRKNRGAFHLTNHHSKRLWLPALLESFVQSRRQFYGRSWQNDLQSGNIACALVTIVHEDWACADTNIQFDVQRAKQKVRRALAGTSFIANFEAAPYRDETWETNGEVGKLISFHCHAIVWASSLSGLRRLQQRIQGQFKPILGRKRGVHMKKLDCETDVVGAIVYNAKMPVLGKRCVPKNGKKYQRDSRVTFRTRRQLFHALKKHTLFDFWLGGGEGARILRRARNQLKAKYKPRPAPHTRKSPYR